MFKKILLCLFLFLLSTSQVLAEDGSSVKAKVVNIVEEKEIIIDEHKQNYQKIKLKIISGEEKGKELEIENGNIALTSTNLYKINEILLITKEKDEKGNDFWQITDYVRNDGIYLLVIIFGVLVLAISRLRGLSSLLGMGITFSVVFYWILPRIIEGKEPILIAILGSLIIIPITFFLSHGINTKTLIAIIGTLISLVITGILAVIFIEMGKLTGYSSEDAGMLNYMVKGGINMKGVLLAGIIIGAIG